MSHNLSITITRIIIRIKTTLTSVLFCYMKTFVVGSPRLSRCCSIQTYHRRLASKIFENSLPKTFGKTSEIFKRLLKDSTITRGF